MEKKKNKSVFWGIFIIIMGVLFLFNNLDIFGIFFDGWWTLFIIVPSVAGLFYKEDTVASVIGIIIGVLCFLACQDFISWVMVGKIFVPFLIIIIGLSLILKPDFSRVVKNKSDGKIDYIGIFGGVDEKICDTFKGGSSVAVFGAVKLDLSDAIIKEDVVIECVTIFGGTEIILPDNVMLQTGGVAIFGGTENKYRDKGGKKAPTVYINPVTIFGGVELK